MTIPISTPSVWRCAPWFKLRLWLASAVTLKWTFLVTVRKRYIFCALCFELSLKMSSRLCKVCSSALIGRNYRQHERKDTEAFFITFALLEKPAAYSCLVCSQFLNRIDLQQRDQLREAAQRCTEELLEEMHCFPIMCTIQHKPSPEINITRSLLLQRAQKKGTFRRFFGIFLLGDVETQK